MNQQVTVVARLQAKPGQTDELRAALDVLVAESRREPGCDTYDLHIGADDPTLFVFHEHWASREHLQAHDQTEHVVAFRSQAASLLDGPAQIDVVYKAE